MPDPTIIGRRTIPLGYRDMDGSDVTFDGACVIVRMLDNVGTTATAWRPDHDGTALAFATALLPESDGATEHLVLTDVPVLTANEHGVVTVGPGHRFCGTAAEYRALAARNAAIARALEAHEAKPKRSAEFLALRELLAGAVVRVTADTELDALTERVIGMAQRAAETPAPTAPAVGRRWVDTDDGYYRLTWWGLHDLLMSRAPEDRGLQSLFFERLGMLSERERERLLLAAERAGRTGEPCVIESREWPTRQGAREVSVVLQAPSSSDSITGFFWISS